MSNKRNAFILVAGLAVGGGASATCNTPSCTGGNTGGTTQTATNTTNVSTGANTLSTNVAVDTRGTVGNVSAAGGTGTATVGNVTAGGANVNVDTKGTVGNVSTGASTATATVNTAGTVGNVSTGTQNQTVNTAGTVGNVSTGTQNVRTGDTNVNTAGTVGAVTTGPSTSSTSGSGNSSLTLNQTYKASKAAIALGGQNATVVVNDCVYASNIALGLSIADEAAAQVTIPLGANMVKGCGELKAELMTINGANAPEATPAQILLGVKTAGKMAPTTVGAAFADITNPANANRVADELALFARAPREVLVQAPAAAAPADAKSATTVTLNFHGAAAPQATSVPQVPCKGKWVYAPKTNTYSCERN